MAISKPYKFAEKFNKPLQPEAIVECKLATNFG